jgi:charged multivesicular body protein 4
MNFLNLFGKSKQEILSPQVVIQNMRETLDTLEKREIHLEKRVNAFKKEAGSFVKTNKPKALELLKKAKMNEKQLLSIYGQKENLETHILVLEQSITNQNIIESLKQGKNAIENMTKKLNPDDVAELVDNISSSIDASEEITTALSQPIGGVAHDEEELLAMLEEETNEEYINDEMFPKIPIKTYTKPEEEDELAKLVAMME